MTYTIKIMKQSKRQQRLEAKRQENRTITVDVIDSLENAIIHADSVGSNNFAYEGIFYVKVNGVWTANDIVPELLRVPAYKKIYDEYKVKKDCGPKMVKDLLITIFTANLGEGNELDLQKLFA